MSKSKALFFLLVLVATPAAAAKNDRAFVFSAYQPKDFAGTFGVGARALIEYPIPMIDFHAILEATEVIDFEARIATSGPVTFADFGARFRPFVNPHFCLAARLDASLAMSFVQAGDTSLGGFFLTGVTPGVLMSFGAEPFQMTLDAAFPLYFLAGGRTPMGAGPHSEIGTAFIVPALLSVAIEFAVADGLNVYLKGDLYVGLSAEGGLYGPVAYAGISLSSF